MIIYANGQEVNVASIYASKMTKNGKQYPSMVFTFDGEITTDDIVNLTSGDIRVGEFEHKGYTTLNSIKLEVGKITTAEENLAESQSILKILTGNDNTTAEAATEQRNILQDAVQSLDNNRALMMKSYYPTWKECVTKGSIEYATPGFKFMHGDLLYSCVNANPTFQIDWIPGNGTSALYVVVNETHEGTIEDPIPAVVGMEYTYGLYYLDPEDDNIYQCSRSGETEGTTIILHYLPHELANQYFTLI